MDLNIWNVVLMSLLAIVGYFLKNTMDKLSKIESYTYRKGSELDILKNDHTNKYDSMTDKFDELKKVIQDLTLEMKELNKRIK